MPTELFFTKIKQELDEIHDELFSGKATYEELQEILGSLNALHNQLKRLQNDFEIINMYKKRLIKLWKWFFRILIALMICFVVMGSLSVVLGGGLSLIFYTIARSLEIPCEDIDEPITKLLDNIDYKKDIVIKKIKRLGRINQLEIASLSMGEVKEEVPVLTQGRVRKLK